MTSFQEFTLPYRLLLLLGCLAGPVWTAAADPAAFAEVWGYLPPGAEAAPAPARPVTDWAFFGPGLNSQGDLIGLPNPWQIKKFPGRRHLVLAAVDNYALVHLVVTPQFGVRAALIDALMAAVGPYDGLQIDFETVASKDVEAFRSFVADLKARLGPKVLSLALPARSKFVDDAFAYAPLAAVADRIIVMAYDEHWSGSAPGPVASLDWGRRVADYAADRIGPAKLVMGIPFYGRAWADRSFSRAHTFGTVSNLLSQKKISGQDRQGSIPSFEFEETVKVRVFYEDRQSVEDRLNLYAGRGVRQVAFWRLGQEDPAVWDVVKVGGPPALAPGPDEAAGAAGAAEAVGAAAGAVGDQGPRRGPRAE